MKQKGMCYKPKPSASCGPDGSAVWVWKRPPGVKKGDWSLLSNASGAGCCCQRPSYPDVELAVGTLTLTCSTPAKPKKPKKSKEKKSSGKSKKK